MALNFLLKRSGTADKRPDPASMALGELDLNYDDITGGVFYKDSSGNAVKVGPAQVSASAPNATPAGSAGNSAGEFWYDTSSSELKIFDGSSWVETGSNYVPSSAFTAAGDLLVGTGSETYTALAVGTDGQILLANSACTTGLCWGDAPVVSEATRTAFGTVIGCTSPVDFNVSLDPACGAYTNLTTGTCNVALGRLTMVKVSSGSRNVGIGNAALICTTTGCGNVAVGAGSAFFVSSGQNNTALGSGSGNNIGTGSQNVAIGNNVGFSVNNQSCRLAIGFDLNQCWITGDSTLAIKPGAGIIDCANSCGAAGQVLMSDGANAVCWGGGVSGTFTFGTCTVVITNGLITSVT